MIRSKKLELAWSYMLAYENEANPIFERKYTIDKWKYLSTVNIIENTVILTEADKLVKQGLKAKDALHIACAMETACDYFLTTDDIIRKKMKNFLSIKVINPVDFIKIIEEL